MEFWFLRKGATDVPRRRYVVPIHLDNRQNVLFWRVDGGQDFVAGDGDGVGPGAAAFDFDEAQTAGLGVEAFDVVAEVVFADVNGAVAKSDFGLHDGVHGFGFGDGALS